MTLYINNISIKFMHNHILVIHSKFKQKHYQTENTSIEHVTYSHACIQSGLVIQAEKYILIS